MAKAFWRYENRLVALLSLTFGVAFFDRNALNYLIPFIAPEFGLSNTEIGLLASALSLTWAISGYVVGGISDRMGKRKPFLLVTVILFSLCSVLSGLASSFALLFAARLLMGAAEGPILPVSQSLIAAEASPERRGLAMGLMQNFGSNLLGSFAAPVLLVALATALGWRNAFFIAALPGLICALLIWRTVREPAPHPVAAAGDRMALLAMLRERNILFSILMCVLIVSYTVIAWSFMPVYFVKFAGLSPTVMSWMMGILGISATLCSFLVPGLSDRVGRKPVLIGFALIGVLCPLGALFASHSLVLLGTLLLVGWSINGLFPLIMATIPSETIPARYVATSLGLVMGSGEVIGGFSAPTLAGMAADRFGLTAPLWIMIGCSVGIALLATAVIETAPVRRRLIKAGYNQA